MNVEIVKKIENFVKGLCLLALAVVVLNCGGAAPEPVHDEKSGYTFYGDTFDISGTMTVNQLLSAMNNRDTVAAVVKGKVESVCKAKGCWMNVVNDDMAGESFFVKFKDYGFFVPKDSEEEMVIMKGVAYKTVTSVSELKHYAEDKGLSQKDIDAITEPKEEFQFMASGVAMNPS